jgi:DegT/DnrJ/EryC1/StrS aminotransferase family
VRLRAQPPVHSPIGPAALLAGLRAGLTGDRSAGRTVEQLLTQTYGAEAVLLTDSGTSALHLALRLAVEERPGPVALPAYCCYDIATAADAAGVSFLLYDLDPTTLGPDWSSLRHALDQGAGVVVAVHLYGIPVDLAAMQDLAGAAGAVVIEDAAQATGATLGGKPAGSLGRYAVLSFGRGKGMTGGRGGALLLNSSPGARAPRLPALTHRSSSLGDAALLLAQWTLARPSVYGLPLSIPSLRLGETIYHPPTPAGSPSRFALGALTRTIPLALAEASRRRKSANWLLEQIGNSGSIVSPKPPAGAEPGYLRLPVVVHPAAAGPLVTDQARRLGVWRGYPRALSDLENFGVRRLDPGGTTRGARLLAERLFTIPTHGLLYPADRIALVQLLHCVERIPQ